MNICEYLKSEQARDDARMAVELDWLNDHWMTRRDECPQIRPISPGPRAWQRLYVLNCGSRDELAPVVYFRLDGAGFAVTDLGEGCRALRQRTGQWNIDREPLECLTEKVTKNSATMIGDQIVWRRLESAEQLPEAVRMVLLVAHLVAGHDE